VIGLGQSAYYYAALRNWRFSVVTTLAVSVPILEANIRAMGLGPFAARVRASDVPVLELEADPDRATARVVKEAMAAQADDGISAVILGCAGMVQVVDRVEQALDIVTIDPVACAARCMAWLT
jgi:allantoin racemase